MIVWSDATFQYYNMHNPAVILVDASKHGLDDAFLPNGKIAFASKALAPVDQFYPTVS